MPPRKRAPNSHNRSASKARKKRPHRRETGLRAKWTGFRPFRDASGAPLKRYYNLDTLASATDRLLREKRNFVVRAVQGILGPAEVTSLEFELTRENNYRFVFRLEAGNARRKQAQFAFVAAKHHENYSKVLATEHHNLRLLHERAPDHVVKPFAGGRIWLPPGRHKNQPRREVYAYLTQWLGGFHEICLDAKGRLAAIGQKKKAYSKAQTEAIKAEVALAVLRSYDAESGTAMEIPQISSGDLLVTPPAKTEPRIKIAGCRRLLKNATPAKLIHRIAGAEWETEETVFSLAPEDPGVIAEAVRNALGRETGRMWFQHYLHALDRGRLKAHPALPREAVEAFASE